MSEHVFLQTQPNQQQSNTTPKFDTGLCFDKNMSDLNKQSCKNSKNMPKCVESLSNYCREYITTEKDFKTHTNLLNCYLKNCETSTDKIKCMEVCTNVKQ